MAPLPRPLNPKQDNLPLIANLSNVSIPFVVSTFTIYAPIQSRRKMTENCHHFKWDDTDLLARSLS